jgi:hypothetical protein
LQPFAGYDYRNGFRWNGDKFVEVDDQKEPQRARDALRLTPDDDTDEDDGSNGFLELCRAQTMQRAGTINSSPDMKQGRHRQLCPSPWRGNHST